MYNKKGYNVHNKTRQDKTSLTQKCSKLKKMAFTLAEVIIVIGIVGIVAEMTVPTLMNNVETQVYKIAYKKAYSTLLQALNQANADNLLTAAAVPPNTRPTSFDNNFLTLMSEFKTAKQCTSGADNADCWDASGEKYGLNYSAGYPRASEYAFIDASGMAWSQYYSGSLLVFVDTNGFNKPNQWGKDRFALRVVDVNNSNETSMDVPIKVTYSSDNSVNICYTPNKCATDNNYYGKSWLINKN